MFPPKVLDLHEHVFQIPNHHRVQQGSTYNLMGKVVHLGVSPRSGHYVAHVKHASGKWFRVSDKVVAPLMRDEDDPSRNCYMLFYRRDHSASPP